MPCDITEYAAENAKNAAESGYPHDLRDVDRKAALGNAEAALKMLRQGRAEAYLRNLIGIRDAAKAEADRAEQKIAEFLAGR